MHKSFLVMLNSGFISSEMMLNCAIVPVTIAKLSLAQMKLRVVVYIKGAERITYATHSLGERLGQKCNIEMKGYACAIIFNVLPETPNEIMSSHLICKI